MLDLEVKHLLEDGEGLLTLGLGVETNKEEFFLDEGGGEQGVNFSQEGDPGVDWLEIDGVVGLDVVEVGNSVIQNVLDNLTVVTGFHAYKILHDLCIKDLCVTNAHEEIEILNGDVHVECHLDSEHNAQLRGSVLELI